MALATASAWGQQRAEPEAMAVLRRALESQRSVHGTLVQQRSLGGRGERMLLKVRLEGDQGMMVTVLQPLRMQGVTSIDDSKTLRTHMPDEALLLIQPSPLRFQPSVAWRVPLVEDNYRVALSSGPSVAGRPVNVVVLEPRHRPMPTRRLFVDENHHVVLRYEVEVEGQTPVRFVDTMSASYARRTTPSGLAFAVDVSSLKTVTTAGPRLLRDASRARGEVGFGPRVPKRLPFGFRVHEVHLIGRDDAAHIAVRLSDGMVSVTVYQWADGRLGDKEPGDRRSRRQDRHSVWFSLETVRGDPLPAEVSSALLDAFVREG